jgi:hypothetical protein
MRSIQEEPIIGEGSAKNTHLRFLHPNMARSIELRQQLLVEKSGAKRESGDSYTHPRVSFFFRVTLTFAMTPNQVL